MEFDKKTVLKNAWWGWPIALVVVILSAGYHISNLDYQLSKLREQAGVEVSSEQSLQDAVAQLKEENLSLKQMVGQVEGKVIIMGPTADGRIAYGKVAWDDARQTGYFHATHLQKTEIGYVYRFFMGKSETEMILCRSFQPEEDGRASFSFRPKKRMLGSLVFVVTRTQQTSMIPDTENLRAPVGMAILRGSEAPLF